jgi:hypothetical protein
VADDAVTCAGIALQEYMTVLLEQLVAATRFREASLRESERSGDDSARRSLRAIGAVVREREEARRRRERERLLSMSKARQDPESLRGDRAGD